MREEPLTGISSVVGDIMFDGPPKIKSSKDDSSYLPDDAAKQGTDHIEKPASRTRLRAPSEGRSRSGSTEQTTSEVTGNVAEHETQAISLQIVVQPGSG